MAVNRLQNLDAPLPATNSQPTVVSILSGKGGVGKSVLAYNLAVVLAHQGSRCLLVDCDWNFGNIHILANVLPECTLADFMQNESLESDAVISLNERFGMIASPAAVESEIEFSDRSFARFLEKVRELFNGYEFIVLDTPSGILDIIRTAADASDLNIIVINPELTSIADGYGLFKYLVRSNPEILAHIFINKAECEADYEYVYQKFTVLAEQFLQRVPLNAGYLLDDRHVIESVAKQRPIIEIERSSPSVKRLNKLCKLLTAERLDNGSGSRLTRQRNINSKKALADIKG